MSIRMTDKPDAEHEINYISERIDAYIKKREAENWAAVPEDPNVEYMTVRSIRPILEKALNANDNDAELNRVLSELFLGTYKFKDDGSDVQLIRRRSLHKW